MIKRLKAKNIYGNLKDEVLLQGGMFLFYKKESDVPIHIYQEKTGNEIPIGKIINTVSKMK